MSGVNKFWRTARDIVLLFGTDLGDGEDVAKKVFLLRLENQRGIVQRYAHGLVRTRYPEVEWND